MSISGRKAFSQFAAVFVVGVVVSPANASNLDISQSPLFFTQAIDPNVMILLDNSVSMGGGDGTGDSSGGEEPAEGGFDPSESYPHWGDGLEVGKGKNTRIVGTWSSTGTVQARDLYYCDSKGANVGKNNGPDIVSGADVSNFESVFVYGSSGFVSRCIGIEADLGGDSTYNGNYLNYLFDKFGVDGQSVGDPRESQDSTGGTTGDTGGSEPVAGGAGEVAKELSRNIISSFPRIRFGLTTFNDIDGGTVVSGCADGNNNAISAINDVRFNAGGRPLAESFYEITRYFRGLSSAYTNVNHDSPIRHRCQPNFVIAITNGLPTHDVDIPPRSISDPLTGDLPDFDGLSPYTTKDNAPDNFPPFSDGFGPVSGVESEPGYSLFLDDLAKFGQEDLITTGFDDAGESFQDKDNKIQNITTYTIGIESASQMLKDAAEAGGGKSALAGNQQELFRKLEQVTNEIQSRLGSGSSVAANTTRVETGALIFQARFHSEDWRGEVEARPIGNDGSLGAAKWKASEKVPVYTARNIFTINSQTGNAVAFNWANLSSDQQAFLNSDLDGVVDSKGETRLNIIKGKAVTAGSSEAEFFRIRNTLIGDIINSDPIFVGNQNFGFSFLPSPGDDANGEPILAVDASAYPAFVASKENRQDMVYVAANDGMVHGFNADTGVEEFAYIPEAVVPEIKRVIDIDYVENHRYFVDGEQRAVDAYIDSAWKTILIGAQGAGGSAVYALDVSDPTAFATTDVLWEKTSADISALGIAYPAPTISRFANGKWGAVVANGYNSADGRAQLVILNLDDGSVLKIIDTGVGTATDKNGLSTPNPVDVNGDRVTDYIYAGDLHGNMWKFDVRSSDVAEWGVAITQRVKGNDEPRPLFTACDADSCTNASRLSITARPEVTGLPDGSGQIVFFGTGRYLAVGDNIVDSNANVNAFYGLYDRNAQITSRTQLVKQSQIGGDIYIAAIDNFVRVTTEHPVTNQLGWYLPFPALGERHVARPILRNDRVVFSTLVPSLDPCISGGTSFIMELDALQGGRLDKQSPFDTNGDGEVDGSDLITIEDENGESVKVAVSAIKSTVGIVKTPGVVSAGNVEYKYLSGTSGEVQQVVESNGKAEEPSRKSWRQLK